jgi:hypothetical protein
MQIHLNERMIARRAKVGRYASTAGLIVLLIGMVATFRGQQYVWVSFGALLFGLVASQVGTYYMRRWGRNPRPDEILASSLKGLDKRYHFYAWSLPADYVLMGPAGLFVFAAKDHMGQVEYRDGRWRQPFRWTRLLTVFALEGLGNPEREAADQAARLARFLADAWGAEEAAQVPVQGVIVFLAANAELHLTDEPSLPVLPLRRLKDFIRSQGKGEKLSGDVRGKLEELFEA